MTTSKAMRLSGLAAVSAALLLAWPPLSRAQDQPLNAPQQLGMAADGSIGFKTVAEALETLKALPGARATVTQPDSWVVISEPGGMIVWSFTPPAHPAHPAVVRRAAVVGGDKMARLQMTVLCEAKKAPCDRLVQEFRELNARDARAVEERIKGARQQ